MTLPPIPKDRNWSPETWRAGLDEAVRRNTEGRYGTWREWTNGRAPDPFAINFTIAHATTLLDAGIVKPVVSEGAVLLRAACDAYYASPNCDGLHKCPAAIAVIDAALAKARAG